jgi:hypothetical protein
MKALSLKQITARRHELFEVFAARSLEVVTDDPAGACKLAETALKALSGTEHEPPSPTRSTEDANPLSGFETDLQRAYAAD